MRKLLAAAAVLWFTGAALAQGANKPNSTYASPLGYCQLTASGTAAQISTCTNGIPARTAWAVICVETAAIRWRDDGTAPTASIGMPVPAGQCVYYNGTFSAFEIIAQSGSPVVDLSFYDAPGIQ